MKPQGYVERTASQEDSDFRPRIGENNRQPHFASFSPSFKIPCSFCLMSNTQRADEFSTMHLLWLEAVIQQGPVLNQQERDSATVERAQAVQLEQHLTDSGVLFAC